MTLAHFPPTRESRVPKGAVKIADKLSDAVAYLSTNPMTKKPTAMVFVGKQNKPLWFFQFPNEERRSIRIEQAFVDRREHLARMKARRAEPSSTALRNRKLKEVMGKAFGVDKVRVRMPRHGLRLGDARYRRDTP